MEWLDFLRNTSKNTKGEGVVSAPAFSLTKVMAVLAPVVTLLATVVTNWVKKEGNEFTAGQIMVIIVALVAFLALTSSADVLARGIAASSKLRADAATKSAESRLRMTPLTGSVKGRLEKDGPDFDVRVVAVSDGMPAEFLCHHEDGTLTWEPVTKVLLNRPTSG